MKISWMDEHSVKQINVLVLFTFFPLFVNKFIQIENIGEFKAEKLIFKNNLSIYWIYRSFILTFKSSSGSYWKRMSWRWRTGGKERNFNPFTAGCRPKSINSSWMINKGLKLTSGIVFIFAIQSLWLYVILERFENLKSNKIWVFLSILPFDLFLTFSCKS